MWDDRYTKAYAYIIARYNNKDKIFIVEIKGWLKVNNKIKKYLDSQYQMLFIWLS